MVDLGVSLDNIFSMDLSPNDPASLSALKVALQGCEALVICTSAVPQPHVLATLWGAAGHFVRQKLRRNSTDDPFVPVATWKGGQTPQQVTGWLLTTLACSSCLWSAWKCHAWSSMLRLTAQPLNSSSWCQRMDSSSLVVRVSTTP